MRKVLVVVSIRAQNLIGDSADGDSAGAESGVEYIVTGGPLGNKHLELCRKISSANATIHLPLDRCFGLLYSHDKEDYENGEYRTRTCKVSSSMPVVEKYRELSSLVVWETEEEMMKNLLQAQEN